MSQSPLIQVEKLGKCYRRSAGVFKTQSMQAVAAVSFDLYTGETLGVVGESGCGKSTLARMLVGLETPSQGSIRYRGVLLARLGVPIPERIQYVFQDPIAALNPRKTVVQILETPLKHLQRYSAQTRREHVLTMLDAVGLSASYLERYPHELSGGQAQRIAIARALMAHPEVLVLDEPVSALDVSIQAQILALLADLKSEFGLSYLFISHDLSVVENISDRVAVMYFGRLIELARPCDLFTDPRHPYTKLLIDSAPMLGRPRKSSIDVRSMGGLPDPFNPPKGCSFAARCHQRSSQCETQAPKWHTDSEGRGYACWNPLSVHSSFT